MKELSWKVIFDLHVSVDFHMKINGFYMTCNVLTFLVDGNR